MGGKTASARAKRWKITALTALALIVAGYFTLEYAVRGGFAPTQADTDAGGMAISYGADGHRIAGRMYTHGPIRERVPLVVVLHGDAPFRNPGYHYAFASALSERLPGVPIAAVLRPGFADPYGARSDGKRGSATGDDYTREVSIDLWSAITFMRNELGSSSVVLIGHSGGAALAANIAAVADGAVRSTVLVSCPCDVPAFRTHMARQHLHPLWLWPTRSESPLETLENVKQTSIHAITSEHDPITPLAYARAYVRAARSHGLQSMLTALPNRGHEILNDAAVLDLAVTHLQTAMNSSQTFGEKQIGSQMQTGD